MSAGQWLLAYYEAPDAVRMQMRVSVFVLVAIFPPRIPLAFPTP